MLRLGRGFARFLFWMRGLILDLVVVSISVPVSEVFWWMLANGGAADTDGRFCGNETLLMQNVSCCLPCPLEKWVYDDGSFSSPI